MPRLDGHQTTEPLAEHKDWPDPEHSTGYKENDTKPTDDISIECPEPDPVGVSR